MEEIEIYTLEDNKEYLLIDTIFIDNNKYILLSDKNNFRNNCVRKVIVKNNEEFLEIISEDEFNQVMLKFAEKNKDLFE